MIQEVGHTFVLRDPWKEGFFSIQNILLQSPELAASQPHSTKCLFSIISLCSSILGAENRIMTFTETKKEVDGLNLCGHILSAHSPFSRRENGRKGSRDVW